MGADPIAEAYALGEKHARERRAMSHLSEEERKRWIAFSPDQHRAYLRGVRDGQPAAAPLPLSAVVAVQAAHYLLLEHARRGGGRPIDYLRVSPGIAALAALSSRLRPWQESRARQLGIDRQVDAPRVPIRITPLWIPVMVGWTVTRRLVLHRRQPRSTNEQIVATELARSLLEWWAWRPIVKQAEGATAARFL